MCSIGHQSFSCHCILFIEKLLWEDTMLRKAIFILVVFIIAVIATITSCDFQKSSQRLSMKYAL